MLWIYYFLGFVVTFLGALINNIFVFFIGITIIFLLAIFSSHIKIILRLGLLEDEILKIKPIGDTLQGGIKPSSDDEKVAVIKRNDLIDNGKRQLLKGIIQKEREK